MNGNLSLKHVDEQSQFKKEMIDALGSMSTKAHIAVSKPQSRSESPLSTVSTRDDIDRIKGDLMSSGRHINSYIHSFITLLKIVDRPITLDELDSILGVQVMKQLPDDVFKNIQLSDKVRRNDITGTYQYVHHHDIRSSEQLLRTLKSRYLGPPFCSPYDTMRGLNMQDLKEGFQNILAEVDSLVRNKQIIACKSRAGADDYERILFYNHDANNYSSIDYDIKTLWHQQAVPAGSGLQESLKNAGMKAYGYVAPIIDMPSLSQKRKVSSSSKRPNRRIKITNTHLKDVINFDSNA